jgi:amidase
LKEGPVASRFRSAFVPHDITSPIPGAAQGPLAGLTAAVKDMYDIAGERTGGGSPDWLAAQQPAVAHAGAVRAILDAGASIVGKAICDEFFYSVTGANAHYGTPLNPRAPDRLPGGSSSGSAAATAAGACDFALGSDTGGSVRVPAAFCGLYGIRPTLGRMDHSGVMAMAPSFDVAGWLAATPGVLRNVGKVLLRQPSVREPVTRLLVLEEAFAQADAEVAALLRAFLDAAATALPARRAGTIAPEGVEHWREAVRVIQGREVWSTFGAFVTKHQPRMGPGIKERMQMAAAVSESEAAAAREVHEGGRAQIRAIATPGTVLALPTAPCVAPLTTTPAAELDSFRVRVMRLTCIAGIGGLPQVSIPVGSISGCPVGLSFVGWAGGDEALLDLAVALACYVGGATA